MTRHIFGIRHHGPGSARSLRKALIALHPDLILVEGPPEADGLLPMALLPEMQPPVALLTHAPPEAGHPSQASYFPLASFSPEWQAIRYGQQHGIPVRFMDLPGSIRLALPMPPPAEASAAPTPDAEPAEPDIQHDPLYWLAKADGFNDGERWWDYRVEQRRDGADVFAGILEAMTALRQAMDEPPDLLTVLREAYMRRTIRAAERDGYRRIAIVCGAWHSPALSGALPGMSARVDNALLKGLPRRPVTATWVPWTHSRLARGGGYGAGIHAPGWYHYLWTAGDDASDISVGWVTRVARLLRAHDLDAAPAQIIDAVRLAETLAALRGRPIPGLPELTEAVQAAMCLGSETPIRLIYRELIIGETLGKVPPIVPVVPLQRDLEAQCVALALSLSIDAATVDLDLREPRDRACSVLLHRLGLLNIRWGAIQPLPVRRPAHGGLLARITQLKPKPDRLNPDLPVPLSASDARDLKGTAQERWRLQWHPEFAVAVIEASMYGSTIAEAAAAFVVQLADSLPTLPALTALLNRVLLADLPETVMHLMDNLRERAALTSDTLHLMDALPPLVQMLRYGSARETDREAVRAVIDGLLPRLCIGLPHLSAHITDEVAADLLPRLQHTDHALIALNAPAHQADWQAALAKLAAHPAGHPLLRGRAVRLCFNAGTLNRADLLRTVSRELSPATPPLQAAPWLEGLLRASSLTILYDDALWAMLHEWLRALPEAVFIRLLPALRRTFSAFSAAERRQIGERARQNSLFPGLPAHAVASGGTETALIDSVDSERAALVTGVLERLLGVELQTLTGQILGEVNRV